MPIPSAMNTEPGIDRVFIELTQEQSILRKYDERGLTVLQAPISCPVRPSRVLGRCSLTSEQVCRREGVKFDPRRVFYRCVIGLKPAGRVLAGPARG